MTSYALIGLIALLIHAYARIATAFCFVVPCPTYILIHVCARIATTGLFGVLVNLVISIHACVRIAT